MPEIKVGSEVPTSTKTDAARSANFPFLRAESTPSEIPTVSHNMKAPSARLNVNGKASPTIFVTHSWRENEYPNAGAAQ